ncbi:MAG TPA: hypothetical protein DHT39_13520 [Pantoea sp.]|nr:hypothetical protein [Pantoea sp.]
MKNLKNKDIKNQSINNIQLLKCANQSVTGLWLPQVGLHYWAVQGSTHQEDVLRSVGMTASGGREMVRDCGPEKDRE